MLEFQFGSNTNTQLFIAWMVWNNKPFILDSITGNVHVQPDEMDDDVWDQVQDLSGMIV